MSIEQKLAELERLAEQLDEAKRSVKKEAAEDEKEDEPEGNDGESDIENDDEAEGSEDDEKNEGVLSSIATGAGKLASAIGGKPVKNWAKGKAKQMAKDDALNQVRSGKITMGQFLDKHKEIDNDPQYKTESEESKIDLGKLFEGQELSEEFKKSATEIFEAAVSARVNQEVAELKESFEQQQLDEAVALKESLVDKVDGYLDYVVEQWMNKNELAINRGIKTEILESFVSGMKQVFESHYIDVPDEKYDLVEAVKSEKEDLERRLDEQTESIMHLKKNIKDMQKQFAIEESCKGLAETDAEKLRALAEELVFSNTAEFTEKLVLIQENYLVVKKPQSKVLAEEFMTDVPVETIQESAPAIDPSMQRYLKAIEKSGF
jgi:hypothetical protein